MRLTVRVSRENPTAVEALRIVARLLVAARENQPTRLALHPDRPLSVPQRVAS
jgi:hypothetical protein